MKIFHVSTVHPNTDNRIVNKYVRGLANRGFDVVFVCRETAPVVPSNFEYIPLKNNSNLVSRLLNSVRVLRICFGSRSGIFHFHDPELIIIGVLLKMAGMSVVYDVHEDNSLAIMQKHYIPRGLRKIVSSVVVLIEKLASKLFYVVIAEKVYSHRFPKATHAFNYPVQKKIPPITRRLDGPEIELLYTGSVTVDRGLKNHLHLLKILPNVRLTIVGSMRESYMELVNQFLSFDERCRLTLITDPISIPFGVIEEHYQSSKYNFGLALFPTSPHYLDKELTKFFEYAQYSLPVLCSNFPTWDRLVGGNNVGITLDPEELINTDLTIAKMSERYSDMVSSCASFCKQYSWETELGNIEDLYQEIKRMKR